MKRTYKVVETIFTALTAIMWAWIILSFFDIVCHNIESYENYGKYQEWNFLFVLERLIKG